MRDGKPVRQKGTAAISWSMSGETRSISRLWPATATRPVSRSTYCGRRGVPADDPRIRRGVTWLKEHQRASGRWFTPSQSWHTQHYISNAGTAYAILALHACGEIPGPREPAK